MASKNYYIKRKDIGQNRVKRYRINRRIKPRVKHHERAECNCIECARARAFECEPEERNKIFSRRSLCNRSWITFPPTPITSGQNARNVRDDKSLRETYHHRTVCTREAVPRASPIPGNANPENTRRRDTRRNARFPANGSI